MKNLAFWTFVAAGALAGCEHSPLEADYGRSVKLMSESQIYDPRTLNRPSTAAVEGGDSDMLNYAVTNMRTYATDRKEVAKPVMVTIGGNSGQQ